MFREKFGEFEIVSRNHLPVFFNPRAEARVRAGIASCCIREATRRHTPSSSSGLLPFPPVLCRSSLDDPFPTPASNAPTRCDACPSFYFCNRVSLCFAPRPRSRTNPFSFSSLNRLRSVFPPWSIFSPRLFLDFVRIRLFSLSLSSFSFRPLPSLEDYIVEAGIKSEFNFKIFLLL